MKISLFIIVLLACFSSSAQNEKWDSTYRPNTYALRLSQFKMYPNNKKDIIFLGNSITERVEWAELLGNKNIRNRGISGDITFGILERLDEVIEGKPAKVFVLIGINDLSRNIPDTVIIANYKKIIQRIHSGSPKTRIYFQTILPVNNEFKPTRNQFNKDEHISKINEALKNLAVTDNITVIDIHPHFLDAEKKLDKKYTEDGLHLNAEGYKVWAEILKQGNYLKK